MAQGINFSFRGRLGRDPFLRHTNNGNAVCNFSVAINMNDNNTPWVQCAAWGDLAIEISEHYTKGSTIVVLESDPKADKNRDGQPTLAFTIRKLGEVGTERSSGDSSDDDSPPY